MLDFVRITDTLPVLVATPIAWHEVAYTPSLLLDASSLPASLVGDAAFADGCESGYDEYFGFLMRFVGEGGDDLVFVPRLCSLAEVYTEVQDNVLSVLDPRNEPSCVSWFAGFVFGWLSALSKYQPVEAAAGLQVLVSLVAVIMDRPYILASGRRARRPASTLGTPAVVTARCF